MASSQVSQAIRSLQSEIDRELGGGRSVAPSPSARPRIGISVHTVGATSSLALAYSQAIEQAGGLPMLIPTTESTEVLLESLRSVDGLLLTGGADLSPYFLGEEPRRGLGEVQVERDVYELKLIHLAHRLSLPILGICRGHQLLGAAYGSTLYQDLYTQHTSADALEHAPQIDKRKGHHRLQLTDPSSRLYQILGTNLGAEVWVNSIHHQALREVRPPFYEVARASDGVNEAIDAYPELDILAVQWHPEQMVSGGDALQLRLFSHIVERARLYRDACLFHQQYITLDSHTDTPMHFYPQFDLGSSCRTLVDLTKMELGEVTASVMVAYLPQGELSPAGHQQARAQTEEILSELHRQVEAHSQRAIIARSAADVRRAKAEGKRAILPAIENGYAIGEDLSLLQHYRDRYGIAYMTLSHNGDNALCDAACKSAQTHKGLSPLGRRAVEEMNRLGIIIDVSHTSPETVTDVLELSTQPIIASHSSARALCDHARNLTDQQICAIAAKGGVVQVCLYQGFIHQPSEQASILHAVEHIEHIIRLVGIEHVGIGSDFDGDGELVGCRSAEALIRLTMELLQRGYTPEQLALIWSGNFLRILEACQASKQL